MLATNVQYISIDHRRAMATENDNVSLDESRLTKHDEAPRQAMREDDPNSTISDLSDDNSKSTSESKAKRYADKAVKQVAAQYNDTIENLNGELDEADEVIAEQNDSIAALQEELAELRANNGFKNKTIFYDEDDDSMNHDEEKEEKKVDDNNKNNLDVNYDATNEVNKMSHSENEKDQENPPEDKNNPFVILSQYDSDDDQNKENEIKNIQSPPRLNNAIKK